MNPEDSMMKAGRLASMKVGEGGAKNETGKQHSKEALITWNN